MKNRADRGTIANFLSNLEHAERGRHRAPTIAESESRGRHGVNCGAGTVVDQHQFLVRDANNDGWLEYLCPHGLRTWGENGNCEKPTKSGHGHGTFRVAAWAGSGRKRVRRPVVVQVEFR